MNLLIDDVTTMGDAVILMKSAERPGYGHENKFRYRNRAVMCNKNSLRATKNGSQTTWTIQTDDIAADADKCTFFPDKSDEHTSDIEVAQLVAATSA